MTRGDRVMTPLGPGGVAYVRMSAASGYTEPEAVSVVLDSRMRDINYTATMFRAADVTATCPGCGWGVGAVAKTVSCNLGNDCKCGSAREP